MLSYKYYDTPEGQDIYKKVFVTSKYATLAGLGLGTFDVLMFSHPKGLTGTVGRLAFYVGPTVGMAAAFTVTANVAQNMRGKNDKINYFLGGVVAGSVFGAWQRSITIGVPAAVLLGVAAVIKKTGIDEGWTFFPDSRMANQSAISARNDFTMAKDVVELKTWTTGH
ncbi:NADH dehydrogenase (ubiquinone) B14.7 subunit [Choristoneura fumiferana]|uniref:NADH dehydrogenase (ubiquinone) B14.7 subunit n=1 Tax=Choristoneura fumiferana TaxID=7141 RepID=UPI003D154EAA